MPMWLIPCMVPFQSTLPVWGATPESSPTLAMFQFQSTLPVWGATRTGGPPPCQSGISIHAPRVGSDHGGDAVGPASSDISIHAPRVGSDRCIRLSRGPPRDFNPRSPCGERHRGPGISSVPGAISIHAPRVGSDTGGGPPQICETISIHAPRVGSDISIPSRPIVWKFQSTLPVWGATGRLPRK